MSKSVPFFCERAQHSAVGPFLKKLPADHKWVVEIRNMNWQDCQARGRTPGAQHRPGADGYLVCAPALGDERGNPPAPGASIDIRPPEDSREAEPPGSREGLSP